MMDWPYLVQKLADTVSVLAVGGAAVWGVSKYSAAAKAEERARKSAEVEIEVRIARQFDSLLKTVEGYGKKGPVQTGLASQISALRSMVRLVKLHPELKDAARWGLKTLRNAPSMSQVYANLDAALYDIDADD